MGRLSPTDPSAFLPSWPRLSRPFLFAGLTELYTLQPMQKQTLNAECGLNKSQPDTIPGYVTVTPEMITAGERALFLYYNSRFDPLENDSAGFVSTIFLEMEAARNREAGLVPAHP
jgi:hypothetical protein